MPVDSIDTQIVKILSSLPIPSDYRQRIETSVRSRQENAAALQRIEQLKETMERIDVSWGQGFVNKDTYIEKRRQLEQEMESLRPLDYDDLLEAADLLHFMTYWNGCSKVDHPDEARKQLLAKIMDRVFVYDGRVLAMVLYGDFGVVLGENKTAPSEIESAVRCKLLEPGVIALETSSQFGDDGVRYLLCILCISSHLSFVAGKTFVPSKRKVVMFVRAGYSPLVFTWATERKSCEAW